MIKGIFRKPQIYYFIAIFIVYILANVLISGFYKNIPLVIYYAKTVNWIKLGASILLSLAIGFFVAMNSLLVYINYQKRKSCRKETTTTAVATVGGLITGVCPICITGVLPLIAALFGVTISFVSLPFQGIEIQFIILIVLIFSYARLRRNTENFK